MDGVEAGREGGALRPGLAVRAGCPPVTWLAAAAVGPSGSGGRAGAGAGDRAGALWLACGIGGGIGGKLPGNSEGSDLQGRH